MELISRRWGFYYDCYYYRSYEIEIENLICDFKLPFACGDVFLTKMDFIVFFFEVFKVKLVCFKKRTKFATLYE